MNIMRSLAWRSMRKNKNRTMVTVIGIVLSAAMFTAVLGAALSFWDYLVRGVHYTHGDYFVTYHFPDEAQMEEIQASKEISSVADYQALGFVNLSDAINAKFILAAGDQTFFDTMPVILKEGRLPQNSREVVVPESAEWRLRGSGDASIVGRTVSLPINTVYTGYPYGMRPQVEPRTDSVSYKVVGVTEDSLYDSLYVNSKGETQEFINLNSFLTLADSGQPEPIWHRVYLKTASPGAVMGWAANQYGVASYRNTDLLGYYGIFEYSNYSTMILGIVGVLLAVIFICSVSLIYNSFSISVSERRKEFGLLASVGMTKKQLRSLVLTEGALLCLIAVPVGLLLGNGAVVLAVQLLGKYIRVQYTFSISGDVLLKPVLPWYLSAAGALLAVLTVGVSVALPAVRISRRSPISLIRQHSEYRTRKLKRGKPFWQYRFFGVSAVMARKYYTVSRSRYAATVLSLALSVAIFLGAASASTQVRAATDLIVRTQNFDFLIDGTMEELEKVRALDCVEKSAISAGADYTVITDEDKLSEDFKDYWELVTGRFGTSYEYYIRPVQVLYLEDAILLEYLQENGIDPAPYFDPEEPAALQCQSVYDLTLESGAKKTYSMYVLTEQMDRFELLPHNLVALRELDDHSGSDVQGTANLDSQGTPYVQKGKQRYMLDISYDEENVVTVDYYACDMSQKLVNNVYPVTDTLVATISKKVPSFRMGAFIEERPFGVGAAGTLLYAKLADFDSIIMILPLSAQPDSSQRIYHLSVTASDYGELLGYLMDNFEEWDYEDFNNGEASRRSLVQIIDILSWIFMILVTLICACNIFNTVSTNITLRRRDFGMLRSIGMKRGQLQRMLMCECLSYGLRALVVGLPLGCGASLLVQYLMRQVIEADYELPVTAMLTAAACVFAIVLLSMGYASGKLRKDNPIEAIRMENT